MHRIWNKTIIVGCIFLISFLTFVTFAFAYPHYFMRVNQFETENEQLKNVVLVGDSITEGFDIKKYFPGRRFLNRGIGGDGDAVEQSSVAVYFGIADADIAFRDRDTDGGAGGLGDGDQSGEDEREQ